MTSAWGVSWGVSWGGSWGSGIVPPPTPPAPTQGMGPGWDLHHPTYTRKRTPDDIEGDVRRAYERAKGTHTEDERKEAVRDLKRIAREAVEASQAEDAQRLADMARQLDALLKVELSARVFLSSVGELIARQRAQELDDFEAFMILAQAA